MPTSDHRKAPAGYQGCCRAQLDKVDVGGIFVTPANIEKAFDPITKAVELVRGRGVFPVTLAATTRSGHDVALGDERGRHQNPRA